MELESDFKENSRMTSRTQPIAPAHDRLPVSVIKSDIARTKRAPFAMGMAGYLALLWGIGGVIALLSLAIVRLASISVTAFGFTLTPAHWCVLAISVSFMAYAEGYRTFQKIWAPRVVGRAFELRNNWSPIRLLLAPLFCMSFFDATKKRMVTAWITTFSIVVLIVLMNRIAQPWRGLIDTGVVVGLSWGIVCLMRQTIKHLATTKRY